MNKEHVENSLDKIRKIFERASERLEKLKVGEKIPATKLAQELAEEFGSTKEMLYPTLTFLIKDYPKFKIARGATGGITRVEE